jgi:hypothetical protein
MKFNICAIGITLLISSIYMSYMKRDNTKFSKFNSLLDDKQKKIYENIVHERLKIYIIGMVLGLSFALFYVYNNKNDNYKVCKFLSIVYIIKLGFYYLYPKGPLMLYSLKEKEQVDAWADIYTDMKLRWIKSLVVGFFGYLLFAFYF